MKNSKTTIRELTAKYRSILKKCAFINALCILAVVGTANATVTPSTIDDYPYPTGDKTEKIYTVTDTDVFPAVTMTDDPIVNIGSGENTATVTESGNISLSNYAQLNIGSGSSLTIAGSLTNEAKTYVVGDVGLEYDGPRYVQTYYKEGVETRDVNAYSINNFGTITATELRNKEIIINYDGATIDANVYNVLTVDVNGNPLTMPTFENRGTIGIVSDDPATYKTVSNSGKFFNLGNGVIYGNVSNTGTLTSELGNIKGTIDNASGILNTWGTLDRDLNGTVELQYDTTLNAGDAHSIDGIVTNTGTFAVLGDLTVNNAYSSFSNLGTLTIASDGSVISNISNTGVIDNQGIIDGSVTNNANATLTTALSSITGTLTNEGFLNTYGNFNQSVSSFEAGKNLFGGTVNIVNTSKVNDSDINLAKVNLSSDLQVSRKMNVEELVVTSTGNLDIKVGGNVDGNVTNNGTIQNAYSFDADIVNNGSFDNQGTINSTTFVNNGTLTTEMSGIASTTALTNNGSINTQGDLDRDIGGTVNLIGSSHLTTDVTLNDVNLSKTLSVSKNLTVTNLVVLSGTGNLNLTDTGSISGAIVNNRNINNCGTLENGTVTNNYVLSNSKTISSTVINTNTGMFVNSSTATVSGDITNNSSLTNSFTNNGVISGTLTNNGNATNNASITGNVTNNSFLYNNAGASITSDVVNNGSIQNEATITGNLTNSGIIYNQSTAAGTGIVDSEVINNGILINNGNVINTVTDDPSTNSSISNAHTIMNYGNIQTKNFTNSNIVHNLGIIGDNTENDGTIATIYSTLNNTSGHIYNNRLIKVNTVTNNGIIENYDLIAAKTLTNDNKIRNEGYIGVYGNEIAVYNNGSLYNGGVIYGDVTNNAGADLTTTIFTVTGTLRNNGTLNTWGNLESVNGISLNGTTNLIYDSSLKQNATMNNVHVGDPEDLSKKVTLDLETNKLTANSFDVADNSGVALRVKSKDTYGSVSAPNYTIGTGTNLSFVLDRGILTEGNTITLPVFTDGSGNVANVDFTTISNNRYQITKEDSGLYTISYKPSTSGDVLAYGGDQNVINASVAWLDEDDMPEGTKAADIQNTMHTLAQTDMNAFVKEMRSLMPETAPVGYTLSNLINNKIAEAVEGRFMSRRRVKKEQPRRGRNGGDVVANGTTGSVWAKGLYSKAKLDTKLGFDAKTDGVAFGIDGKANEHLTIGVGYAYTGSDVDSKSRKTDVTTHTGILYSEYLNGQCFVNGVVDYNRSEYEEKRNVSGSAVKGDYTSDVAFARVMGGFHIPVDYFIFTPETGLRYLWIKMNGYTDSIGQTVHDESASSLTGVVGLRVGAKTKLIGLDQVLLFVEHMILSKQITTLLLAYQMAVITL